MKYLALGLGCAALLVGEGPTSIYTLYAPVAVNGYVSGKGLALSADWACGDIAAVNADWYFTWSETAPYCEGQTSAEWVPMAVEGHPGKCYPVVLLYNEPTITPALAVVDVATYQAVCPNSLTVLGNVAQSNLAWLTATLALLPNYNGAVGIHAYCWYTADDCLSTFAAAAMGRPIWITETAIFHAEPGEVARLLAGARTCCERVAWYPNRETAGDSFNGREAALFDSAGALTPAGIAFGE